MLTNDFIENSDFEYVLRNWIQEGLDKGNGFMEIGINKDEIQLKTINANNMYVKRSSTMVKSYPFRLPIA